MSQLLPLVEAIPPIRARRGDKPRLVQADRATIMTNTASRSTPAGIKTLIARRGELYGSGLRQDPMVVERTIAWLHNFRDCAFASMSACLSFTKYPIACCLICWRTLRND